MNIFYTYLFLGLFSGKLPQYQKKNPILKILNKSLFKETRKHSQSNNLKTKKHSIRYKIPNI